MVFDGDSEVIGASVVEPTRFEEIFDVHHAEIWRFLARVGGRDHADELAGEVFVVAFTRRHTFRPDRGTVRSWLFGIAANVSRTKLRSERRRERAYLRVAALRDRVPEPPDGLDALEAAQRAELLAAAFERLPVRDREILALCVGRGMSYEEVAGALGVPVGTVRSRLSRSRQRLRELVAISGQEVL